MILKNWSVFTTVANEFLPPEAGFPHLQGNVYNNPKFKDGTFVHTSRIVEIRDMGSYKLGITRSGSEYELHKEDVSVKCDKQFPNYYDRLQLK